jgi:hypothetical protein
MTRDTPRCPIFGPKIWEFSGGPPGPPTPDLIIPRNFGRSNLNYHVINFFPALPVWPKMARKHSGLGGSPRPPMHRIWPNFFLALGDHKSYSWNKIQNFLRRKFFFRAHFRFWSYPPLHKIPILQKTPIYNLISFGAKKH